MLATNKSFLRLSVFIRQLCNLQEATSDYYSDHIFKLNFAKNLVSMESTHFYNRPAFSIKKITEYYRAYPGACLKLCQIKIQYNRIFMLIFVMHLVATLTKTGIRIIN